MVLVDNLDLGDETAVALRDRSALSKDGVVFVVATIAQQDGETLAPIEIVLRGLPLTEPEDQLIEAVRATPSSALWTVPGSRTLPTSARSRRPSRTTCRRSSTSGPGAARCCCR